MKLIIASDIHGSASYCELLLKRFKEEQADRMLLLGDILYHGPRNPMPEQYDTKKTFTMLNEHKDKIISVKGNCDSEVDQMVLDFPIMAEYTMLAVNGLTICASHGHTISEDNPLPFRNNEILICGHTHVPVCSEHDNFIFMNPGSVGLPKENTPHSYMILEDRTFTWKDLETGEAFAECTVK